MALCLFLPRQPASRAEGVSFAFDERTTAASAVLRRDSAELGAFVAVGTEIATLDFIPVCAHEPLPVGIIVNVVDALAEH